MGKYFGTDGFRGEANVTLTVDHAFKVGRFLGWFYGKEKEDGKAKIVIGKDTRRSSYMFEYSLVAGLTASGADVYLLHVTTTPSVAYVTRTEDFDCGIMISASHNPFYDNGIKLINSKGEKMREDVIGEIEKYLDGEMGDIPYATKEQIGCTVDHTAGRNRYMGYLMSLAIYSFKGMRIGLDASNGSAWTLAKAVFDALGAKTYVINASPDGTNINANCGSTHIEGLCDLVKREHLDAGFAFDGDADRCLCVDENGDVITGDHILYIYGCYMKERGKLIDNTVVTTVMSNFGLYKAFDAAGIDYEKTKVGDKYVYENMLQNGYVLGGEQSGHIIFLDENTTGDGLLSALHLLEVMVVTGKPLSELSKIMTVLPQALVNVTVPNHRKEHFMEYPEIAAAIEELEKEFAGEGRVLIRPSGTEPKVRVMIEGKDKERIDKEAHRIADLIQQLML